MPLKSGRDFTDADRRDAPIVAIINESLARASFAGQDPIGQQIQCGLDTLDFMTIVGVVGDVRTRGPGSPAQPEIYMPFEQHPGPATALTLVARTSAPDPPALADAIRRRISGAEPRRAGQGRDDGGHARRRDGDAAFPDVPARGVCARGAALALAGVYGVMAYTVSQRVPELGVRIALGATPKTSAAGLRPGGEARERRPGDRHRPLAARQAAPEGLLFGVTASDPWMLAAVAAVIASAALGACYIPVRRATRVDPMVALRSE